MSIINGYGEQNELDHVFREIFSFDRINLCDYENPDYNANFKIGFYIPVEFGVTYVMNPFGTLYNNSVLQLCDADKNVIVNQVGNYFSSRNGVCVLDGRRYQYKTYNDISKVQDDSYSDGSITTIDVSANDIAYIYVQNNTNATLSDRTTPTRFGMTKREHVSSVYVPYSTYYAYVNDDLNVYWDKAKSTLLEHMSDDLKPMIRADAIRAMNESRECIRVGTFNMSPGLGVAKVRAMKHMFSDYGLDFVGLQEVKNEITSAGGANYQQKLTSNLLPYSDGTASIDLVTPWMENVILSRYEIQSAEKVEYQNLGGESRQYVKVVVKLPRYKDYYPDGDQYLSIYCTHLDLYINRKLQAQELCAAMLADTNMFKVAVMDSNDFTATKEVWKVFTDAGFAQAHDGTSKTETVDETFDASASLDQIFCTDNMEVVFYDVISSNNYKVDNVAISDHGLVFADLQLDYGTISYPPINPQSLPSTIYHVTRNMTNVSDNFVATNLVSGWKYNSTLTADDGYVISSVTVTMGGSDITASAYNSSTHALSFTVTGDVVITATAEAQA